MAVPKLFKVAVTWQAYAEVSVQALTEEQAMEMVENSYSLHPPPNSEYNGGFTLLNCAEISPFQLHPTEMVLVSSNKELVQALNLASYPPMMSFQSIDQDPWADPFVPIDQEDSKVKFEEVEEEFLKTFSSKEAVTKNYEPDP